MTNMTNEKMSVTADPTDIKRIHDNQLTLQK